MRERILYSAVMAILMSISIHGEDATSVKTVEPTRTSPVINIAKSSFQKKGFVTTKWCAENGYFIDCRLETLACGGGECFRDWEYGDKQHTDLVLYVHKDLQYYHLKPSKEFNSSEFISNCFGKNSIKVVGEYNKKENTITIYEYVVPSE